MHWYPLVCAEKERRNEDEVALATLKQQLEVLQRSNLQQKRELEYAKARTSFSSSARKSLENFPQRDDSVHGDMPSPSRSVSADDLGGSMAVLWKSVCRTSVCQRYLLQLENFGIKTDESNLLPRSLHHASLSCWCRLPHRL